MARPFDLIVGAALLGPVLAFAFVPVVRILIGQWLTDDTYSFGILVPIISGYFVWLRWDYLKSLPIVPSPVAGLAAVTMCAMALMLGRMTVLVGVQQIAMVLMVPSLVWLFLGRRFLFALWFPLLYLLLMLPVWEVLTNRLHYRSQLFSAFLGEQLLTLAGVTVHRSETYLEMSNITLEVASVCSGINFVIAVIAIGVPQAYLFLSGFIPRAIVIGFAVAIALFSNGVRIAIIGLLSQYRPSGDIHGPGHLLQGLFVSAFGLIALQAAISFMARRYPRVNSSRGGVVPAVPASSQPRWYLAVAIIIGAVVITAAARSQFSGRVPLVSDGIPSNVALSGWSPIRVNRITRFVRGGPVENLATMFQLPSGQRIDLYVNSIVYADGSQLGYRSVALPSNAMPSEAPIHTSHGTVMVNRASFRENDSVTDIVFWFDINGRKTSQLITAKLHAIRSLLGGSPPVPRLVLMSFSRPLSAADQHVESIEELVNQVFLALEPLALTGAATETGVGNEHR